MRRNEKGFTLIELLVVMAIIGILAAIAIPQFAEYRMRGFDSRARSDLRNVATAEEAYFVDYEKYLACTLTDGAGSCDTGLPGLDEMSSSVDLEIFVSSDTATGFTGTSTSTRGSGAAYDWDSDSGGMQ